MGLLGGILLGIVVALCCFFFKQHKKNVENNKNDINLLEQSITTQP